MGTVRYTVIDGEIIAEKRNGVRKQYVPDSLGSTVALLDNTQTQTDTFTYWPYGEVASRTGTTPTPFQYVGTAGYRQDSTSKSYVRARVLDVPKGRWLTEDPIGFDGDDYNLYIYCSSNPSTSVDASGMQKTISPFPKPIDWRYNCMGFAFDTCQWLRIKDFLGTNGLASCKKILAFARTLGLKPMINGKCKPGYHRVALFATGTGGTTFDKSQDMHWYRQWEDGHWSSKHGNTQPIDTGPNGERLKNINQVKHDAHCENYIQDCGVFCVPDKSPRPFSPPGKSMFPPVR